MVRSTVRLTKTLGKKWSDELHVTTGNIAELVKWFHAGRWRLGENYWDPARENHNFCKYKLLCLIVAGDLSDHSLFEDIFLNKAAINTITGNDIAVFLFAPKQLSALQIDIDNGKGIIIPGRVLTDNIGVSQISIDRVGLERKQEVIEKSKFISKEICDYFSISAKEIPAILLLRKHEQVPIIIPTKGEADIKNFFKFICELRDISDSLPDIDNLKKNISDKERKLGLVNKFHKQQERISKLSQLKVNLDNMALKAKTCCDTLISILSEKYNSTEEGASDLLKYNDIIHYRSTLNKSTFVTSLSEDAELLYEPLIDEKFIKYFRRYGKSRRAMLSISNQIANLEHKIREYKSVIETQFVDVNLSSLQKEVDEMDFVFRSIYSDVEKLSDSYKSKFEKRKKLSSINEFILGFLNFTKKSKDLISIKKSIHRMIDM